MTIINCSTYGSFLFGAPHESKELRYTLQITSSLSPFNGVSGAGRPRAVGEPVTSVGPKAVPPAEEPVVADDADTSSRVSAPTPRRVPLPRVGERGPEVLVAVVRVAGETPVS